MNDHSTVRPVFVLNLPGLDRRRMDAETFPFLHDLLERHEVVQWDGHPTTEIWPTMVTGVNPGEHDIWHCRLDDKGPANSLAERFLEKVPDKLVSTVQLARHFIDRHYEMPCIPYRRRRHLEFHRLKFNARSEPHQYRTVGGIGTIFDVMGDDAHYCVTGRYEDIERLMRDLPANDKKLQWFEIHAYDIAVHYSIHKPAELAERGRVIDDVARRLYERCQALGTTFVLVVDHGQEPVAGSVNLPQVLRHSGVSPKDYVYFLAVGVGKFWFKNESARERIRAALEATEHVNVLDWQELNKKFDFSLLPEWGELYAITDNDHVFFPHDFHHLLAHIHLGLTSKAMRSRLTDFNIKGYHGLMPGHPAELGYLLVADDQWQPSARTDELVQIKDVAPTLLHMVDVEPAEHMRGQARMQRAANGTGTTDSRNGST